MDATQMAVVTWQAAQQQGQGGWGVLFWLWLAVMVVLLGLIIVRATRGRRRPPPIDPNLR